MNEHGMLANATRVTICLLFSTIFEHFAAIKAQCKQWLQYPIYMSKKEVAVAFLEGCLFSSQSEISPDWLKKVSALVFFFEHINYVPTERFLHEFSLSEL